MTDQQQAEDVSLQRGGGEGEEKPEEEGMAVEGADVEEGRSEGEQAAAGGESVGDVLMGEQGDEHTEQQHHHHSRGGPGGAGEKMRRLDVLRVAVASRISRRECSAL